jgi:ubiquinone/menaquinone biosynthesis C-methylase UbiE
MVELEMNQYMKDLIQKYDYYDPIKDRTEALNFAKVKNKKILDIGTGNGHIAILAAKDFKCNVTTIDLSKEKIKVAKENAEKEKVANKINFRIADATKIPYPENTFDVVITFNALHHSKGKFKKIITEMIRVSKNKIVITELNENGVKVFDEYIHPDENHKSMAINMNELLLFLKQQSEVKVLERKLMTTYVCEKTRRNQDDVQNTN